MGNQEIHVLTRNEINEDKWNNCLRADPKGLIYSYAWYLDCMAADWIGLARGDYEQIMALPIRKKWGINYTFKPPFTGQLGVFGKKVSPQLISDFLKSIPASIKYIDYPLNQAVRKEGFTSHQEINYVLNLEPAYDTLRKNYKENTIRNIEKSKEKGKVIKTESCHDAVRLALEQFSGFPGRVLEDIRKYERLDKICPPENRNINYAYVTEDNQIVSATSVMRSNGRIYYLLASTSEKGRKLGASHKITDQIIRDFAGSDTLLDFEGSSISGIARFYEGFGANPEYYQHIRQNRLPFFLKFFKS